MSWEDRDYSEPVGQFQRRWTVNWVFIAASIGVFVLAMLWQHVLFRTSSAGPLFMAHVALHPTDVVLRFHDWQLVTHLFLDYGPLSLLFNMLALYWFGNDLEELAGRKSYCLLFFGGGLVSAFTFVVLGFLIWPGQAFTGPSGAIAAMMVAAALTWPNRQVILFFVPVKLKFVVLVWIGLDVYSTVTQLGVASLAHLSGAAWGLAYWKLRHRVADAFAGMDQRAAIRQARRQRNAADARELQIDRILRKISESGLGSLTAEERAALDAESRRKASR